MLRKIRKDQPVTSAADLMDDSRTKVMALVERERIIHRSMMRAYENVGGMIGRSPSWIEKLIGRRLDTKRPDAVALLNIQACYDRYIHVCKAIEASADDLSAKAQEYTDAAAQSDHPMAPRGGPVHVSPSPLPLETQPPLDPYAEMDDMPACLVRKRGGG